MGGFLPLLMVLMGRGPTASRGISQNVKKLSSFFSFEVGDGSTIFVCMNRWSDGAPLGEIFPTLFALAMDRDAFVAHHWGRASRASVWVLVFVPDGLVD